MSGPTAGIEVMPFDDDVEATVDRDGEAPAGPEPEGAELAGIEAQVAAIVAANAGRAPAEQMSVDPEEVN